MIRVVIADDIQILRKGLEAILSQDAEICVVGLAADGKEAWELCREKEPDVVLMDMRMPGFDGAWGIRKIKEDLPQIKALVLTTFDDQETVDKAVRSGADGYILKEMEDGKVIQSIKAVCAGIRVFGDSVFEGMRQRMAAPEREEGAGLEEEGTGLGDRAGLGPGAGRTLKTGMGSGTKAGPAAGIGAGVGAGPCQGAGLEAGERRGPDRKDPDQTADALGLTSRERDIMRCVAQGMDNKEIAASLFLAEGTVRNNLSRLLEKLKLKDRTQLAVFTVKHHLDG